MPWSSEVVAMRMRWVAVIISSAALAASMLAADPAGAAAQTTVHFPAASGDVPNPERGFYRTAESPTDLAQLQAYRAQGYTVVHLNADLGAYRSGPLPEAFLSQVAADFSNARTAGVKLIPRFAYDFTAAGNDAPLDVVLTQIRQLSPVLHANGDVIVSVEAGFIGAWGEWHDSSNHLINNFETDFGHEVNAATRAIYAALLDAVPADRMIAVRTPRYKWELFETKAHVNPDDAYSGSAISRTGFHNDCFLANSTDYGTYANRAADEAWLNVETSFVSQTGETCAADPDAAPYIACPNALRELRGQHWSTLNEEWNPDVYSIWAQQGCLDTVRQDLGYRFRLVDATAPTRIAPGQDLPLRLTVANDGFATPYNPHPVEVVLRNVATGDEVHLATAADPRWWSAGQTTLVHADVRVPAGLAAGSYQVLLDLPDPAPGLHSRPDYAIRMANQDTWEPATGYNNLHMTVLAA
jgi:hypothetical protein